jgi:rhodanese-related sulfurtransferase
LGLSCNYRIVMMKRFFLFLLPVVLMAVPGFAADPKAPTTKVQRIDVEQYDKLRANTNNVLLDVRTKAEYEKGHIPGTTNIDISSPRFDESVAKLDTNKTYLVNCAVGMRSARACKKLEGMGFKNLYDLAPGFDGWKKAGKPVDK